MDLNYSTTELAFRDDVRMGMSDEMKVSRTFRRLTLIAQQFGDADRHLERFACPQ